MQGRKLDGAPRGEAMRVVVRVTDARAVAVATMFPDRYEPVLSQNSDVAAATLKYLVSRYSRGA